MGSTYKRLFSGYGTPMVPTLAYTVPAVTNTLLKEIQVTNVGAGGPAAILPTTVYDSCQTPDGTIYFTGGSGAHAVWKLATDGTVSIFCGLPKVSGDVLAAGTAARFVHLESIVADSTGTYLYVHDRGNAKIKRITISTATPILMGTPTGTDSAFPQGRMSVSPDGTKLVIPTTTNANNRYLLTMLTTTPYTVVIVASQSATPGPEWISACWNDAGTYAFVAGTLEGNKGSVISIKISDGTIQTLFSSNTAATTTFSDGDTGSNVYLGGRITDLVIDEPAAGVVHVYFVSEDSALRYARVHCSATYVPTAGLVGTLIGPVMFASGTTEVGGFLAGYLPTSRAQPLSLCYNSDGRHLIMTQPGGLMRYNLDDGFASPLAGNDPTIVGVAGTEGSATYSLTGYFNLYIVPSGDTLNTRLHKRFVNESVARGEAWFGEIHKNLNAGDKIYFEPLISGLALELSGLEAA